MGRKGPENKIQLVSIWKPWWWLGNGKKRLLLFTVYGENGLIFSLDYNSNDWLWILFVCFFSYPTYYERKVLGEGLFDLRPIVPTSLRAHLFYEWSGKKKRQQVSVSNVYNVSTWMSVICLWSDNMRSYEWRWWLDHWSKSYEFQNFKNHTNVQIKPHECFGE